VNSDETDPDDPASAYRLSEKEAFLLLLVAIAILMAATGFVLAIN
jgi:hypothetical protein